MQVGVRSPRPGAWRFALLGAAFSPASGDAGDGSPPKNRRPLRRNLLPSCPHWPRGNASMRTSRITSRLVVPTGRPPSAGPSGNGRGPATAWVLTGLVTGLVLLLGGCGTGDGNVSSTRTSTERSGTRPAPSVTESPSAAAPPTRRT